MPTRSPLILLSLWAIAAPPLLAQKDFPIVPEDFQVSLFARDPIIRNPCAITFDAKGRLCVGMGPQYRSPKPDTKPDSVWIITDEDSDGKAEKRHQFATGFNSIQGMAWKGDWLWIANAPDLTRVRDTDGDDLADEYIRVFTDLGNLEHGLHGLNFGPDGRLYMSKGNSKGLTQLPDRLAPAPFRELWGVHVPLGTEEPKPRSFTSKDYQKNFHDPRDDWGISGGILRCDDDGSNLEIVSRGFRNPWDIAFDDHFNWLGTDNDQTHGDKIFTPFFGSHFGWGHAWSYDWKGDEHLPTSPSSGPLFEGSGAGVIYANHPGYPERYRDVFLINDWLNREVLIYKSRWDGAWRKSATTQLPVLAHAEGGRSMPLSKGRSFDPVDIEIGPDGAIWISSWGRQYGAHFEHNKLANEGRIYRLWPKEFSPAVKAEKATTVEALIGQLGSHLPIWRSNAQEELINRGNKVKSQLLAALRNPKRTTAHETWLVWTLGRINPKSWFDSTPNQLIQSIRLAAFNGRIDLKVLAALKNSNPQVRLAAVIALRELDQKNSSQSIIDLLAKESDRVVYYAAWGALMDLLPIPEQKRLLTDKRPQVRLAILLTLLEKDALSDKEIITLLDDIHPPVAQIAAKRLGGKHQHELRGRPLESEEELKHQAPLVTPFSDITPSSGHLYRTALLQAGTRPYTDRGYRITKVPPELAGLAFLQTACSDADASSGTTVSLNLKYPSTVYFIDDARGEKLPIWARGKWKETPLIIEGDDPKKMKVYRADLPAGPLTLGSNRDDVRARKGNYLLAAQPTLLSSDGKLATESTILPLLKEAGPARGHDLFFSPLGANCSSCHQVLGRGNNHAPDLSDIGSRADASTIIESIIKPSASIVEGFAAHQITTHAGKAHLGIILQETGRSVTLAQTGGSTIEISRKKIKARSTLSVSAMPEGFAAMLTSQQLADITAWMLTLKKTKALQPANGVFQFHKKDNELQVILNEKQIASYLLDHPKISRRAFVNFKTPSGIQVTRNFPARAPEDLDRNGKSIIHPFMHPGLWMSFGWIDGNDYWRFTSPVVLEKFSEVPINNPGSACFETRDRYLAKDRKETICIQDTRYHFQHVEEGILLHWDSKFYNDERDFTFGDQEESGLALRIASPLRVEGGKGRITNNRNEFNSSGTWGKKFRWIDYSGPINDKQAGILVIPHPENPRKSWSHSRDYGVLASNPFPKQPKERREPYITTTVKKGEHYRLRYSILIHESDLSSFDPAILAERVIASGFPTE